MKVRIFGMKEFESKWMPNPRGWVSHKSLCNGAVLVHDLWYYKGYQHAATYDHEQVSRIEVLDWCQENAPNESIVHPSGAVLFKDELKAMHFAMAIA